MTHVLRPRIAIAAANAIRAASLRQGAEFEVTFCCTWNDVEQQITSAVPVFRGNATAARFIPHQFVFGELMLHTHPTSSVTPSDLDLDCAVTAAGHGVGFAVCDTAAETLFVVTSPQDVAPRRPPTTPTQRAWQAAIRRWSFTLFGRSLDLVLYPPKSLPAH